MAQAWYVLHLAPRAEPEVLRLLQGHRFAYYKFTYLKRRTRGKPHRLGLFPGYLFVHMDPAVEPWEQMLGWDGVVDVLRSAPSRPSPLPPGCFEELLARHAGKEQEPGATAPEAGPAEVVKFGDLVRLVAGPFVGLMYRAERVTKRLVCGHLTMHGGRLWVEAGRADVRRLEDPEPGAQRLAA